MLSYMKITKRLIFTGILLLTLTGVLLPLLRESVNGDRGWPYQFYRSQRVGFPSKATQECYARNGFAHGEEIYIAACSNEQVTGPSKIDYKRLVSDIAIWAVIAVAIGSAVYYFKSPKAGK